MKRLISILLLLVSINSFCQDRITIRGGKVNTGSFISQTPIPSNERIITSHTMAAFTDHSSNITQWLQQYKDDGFNQVWFYADYYYPGATTFNFLNAAAAVGIPVLMGNIGGDAAADSAGARVISGAFAQMVYETWNHPAIYRHNGKRVYHKYDYKGDLQSIIDALHREYVGNESYYGFEVTINDFELWTTRLNYPYYYDFGTPQWYDFYGIPPQGDASIDRVFAIEPESKGLVNFAVDQATSTASQARDKIIIQNQLISKGSLRNNAIAIACISHNYHSAQQWALGFDGSLAILKNILSQPLSQWPLGLSYTTANDYQERSYMNMPMNPPDSNGWSFVPAVSTSGYTLGGTIAYPLMDNSGLRAFLKPWQDKFKASDTTPVTFSSDRIFYWYMLHPLNATSVTTVPSYLATRWGSTVNGIPIQTYWNSTFYASGDANTTNINAGDTAYTNIRMACHLTSSAVLRITIGGVNYDSPTRSAGDAYWEIGMGSKRGTPSFSIVRSGVVVKSGIGRQAITNFNWPGGYNSLIQEAKYD